MTAERRRALAIERAVRASARAGNGLIAGASARVEVRDPALRDELEAVLARMGARRPAEAHADFAFVDALAPSDPAPSDPASADPVPSDPASAVPASAVPASAVPAPADSGVATVTVALDGEVACARGSSARERIAWAAGRMRATAALAERLRAEPAAAATRPNGEGGSGFGTGAATRPVRIAVSLVLEPKTAALALLLAASGFEVAVFSAVSETDPEVAAALAADGRVAVFAPIGAGGAGAGETGAEPVIPARGDSAPGDPAPGNPESADPVTLDAAHAAAILRWRPDYLVDDGAHLIRLAHTEHPDALKRLRGAAEETTSGVRPLREMAADGVLRIPVIAVNDARTKTDFDNLVGTGQSCVFAIAELLDEAGWRAPGVDGPPGGPAGGPQAAGYSGLAGTRWAVIGYGPVGVGVARFAAALGARVTVVERDAVRALAALHDGFDALRAEEALPAADVVVSATGVWHTVDAAGLAGLRPGTAIAVAGGIDDELALDELRVAGWHREARGRQLAEWIRPGAERGPVVLSSGAGVNYTAAEGNPVEVMDLSFATQLAALARLMRGALPPGVHALSADEEQLVARAALAARGASADPASGRSRPGGAAQPWCVHRYRT